MPVASQHETSRIVELRRYALRPGARDTLIELFDREFVESQEALGMHLLGQFRDVDDPDSFVWMRGFADMETRQRALEDFYGGPVWKAHADAANATMVDVDNVLLLHPVKGVVLDGTDRPDPGVLASQPGLLVVTIYPLLGSGADTFADLFHQEIQPLLEAAGIPVLATYASEHSPNNFPALPVREGEEVFLWMTLFADEADHRQRIHSLEQRPSWRDMASVAESRWLSGTPEVLRLRPTARSRLHG